MVGSTTVTCLQPDVARVVEIAREYLRTMSNAALLGAITLTTLLAVIVGLVASKRGVQLWKRLVLLAAGQRFCGSWQRATVLLSAVLVLITGVSWVRVIRYADTKERERKIAEAFADMAKNARRILIRFHDKSSRKTLISSPSGVSTFIETLFAMQHAEPLDAVNAFALADITVETRKNRYAFLAAFHNKDGWKTQFQFTGDQKDGLPGFGFVNSKLGAYLRSLCNLQKK